MTIDYCYWECDHKCSYARQVEKETFESYFWKQEKASTAGNATAFQNKINTFLADLSAKSSFSKPFLSSASKKQPNSSWMDLSSKLASNSKLTGNKCKKQLKNNLCLYYSVRDHELNSCSKKQTIITSKSYSTLATTDLLAAASKKLLEK